MPCSLVRLVCFWSKLKCSSWWCWLCTLGNNNSLTLCRRSWSPFSCRMPMMVFRVSAKAANWSSLDCNIHLTASWVAPWTSIWARSNQWTSSITSWISTWVAISATCASTYSPRACKRSCIVSWVLLWASKHFTWHWNPFACVANMAITFPINLPSSSSTLP